MMMQPSSSDIVEMWLSVQPNRPVKGSIKSIPPNAGHNDKMLGRGKPVRKLKEYVNAVALDS